MEINFEEVVQAYFDCRKHKRRTLYALDFEFDLERNLFNLFEELRDGHYQIGKNIAFVVEQPKIREIWSATFRDRIVHHLIYNRLCPRFYPSFIRDTFACIPGRGNLDASNRLWAGMRSITRNWKKPACFLGADVRNFFPSIYKPTLYEQLLKKAHEPWLRDLTRQVLFHDPRTNCCARSSQEAFARVPAYKSLWHSPLDRGLPIGNLTSQFWANVYLNEFDQWVKHDLRARYYYRYVDDFIILHESPDYLNECYKRAEKFLAERLKIELHPFKRRLGIIDQGIDFVGYFHKPYRRHPRQRTANRMKSAVNRWLIDPDALSGGSLKRLRDSFNSYSGIMRHTASYRLRRHLGEKINCLFVAPDESYTKLVLRSSK